jgi:phosphoglycolate phosphatase
LIRQRVLTQVLKKQKIDKTEAIYVGDEIRDIEAAQKVGMKIISVTWGFNAKESLQKFHPDALADTPDEFLHFVHVLNGL